MMEGGKEEDREGFTSVAAGFKPQHKNGKQEKGELFVFATTVQPATARSNKDNSAVSYYSSIQCAPGVCINFVIHLHLFSFSQFTCTFSHSPSSLGRTGDIHHNYMFFMLPQK